MSARDDLKKLIDAGLVPTDSHIISMALHRLPYIDSGCPIGKPCPVMAARGKEASDAHS